MSDIPEIITTEYVTDKRTNGTVGTTQIHHLSSATEAVETTAKASYGERVTADGDEANARAEFDHGPFFRVCISSQMV